MLKELITRAGLTNDTAAKYLGISRRTLRRYIARGIAPRACVEALRRRNWHPPEALEYAECLGVLRGMETERRANAP